MLRYAPIFAGIALIVGLTIVQSRMTDRFSDANYSADQQAILLKNVPLNFGDWRGVDKEVNETVRQTAGAIGAVSRQYRNIRTGEEVDLWLIVGHAREISAHTPNICYKASGWEPRASTDSLYPMTFAKDDAQFWTNTYYREDTIAGRRFLQRVFWSWFNPEDESHEGKVVWEAPKNPWYHFGNTRALFKMYFTSEMRDPLETTDQSACIMFARDFLPIVNSALAQVYGGAPTATSPGGSSASPVTAETPKLDFETAATPSIEDAAEPVDNAGTYEATPPAATVPAPEPAESAEPAAAPK
jgi:hypothetical protein